jgi:AcrR family transcriptional regulator
MLRRSERVLDQPREDTEAITVMFGAIESRPYQQNKQSRRILVAAREVFIREGAAAFSARRVAKAAKLSLGSVQHVFPTTDELITAMLEHVNDDYDAAYRAMAEKLPFSPEQRLTAALDYLLQDICQADTRRFWFGFWALSCHNKHAESLLKQAYQHYCNNVAGFIGAARAHFSDARCSELAVQIIALIDGTMLFTGMARKALTLRSPLISRLRTTIWGMLDSKERGDEAPIPSAAFAPRRKQRVSAPPPLADLLDP